MNWLKRIALVLFIAIIAMIAYGRWWFTDTHNAIRDESYQARIHYLWADIPNAAKLYNWRGQGDDEVSWFFSGINNPFMKDGPHIVAYPLETKKPSAAMLLLPGGGYGFRSELREGVEIAEWLQAQGIAAFILNYRLDHHPAPLADTKLAMRMLRHQAGEFNIDPNRIGVMGFSAGGHLAATLSTLHDKTIEGDETHSALSQYSSRPDFAVLAYAVISFDDDRNVGTRNNLIGDEANESLKVLLSPQRQASANSPPSFIWAPKTDSVVPFENSSEYARALTQAGVQNELVLFETGSHGSALAADEEEAGQWPALMMDWLGDIGMRD